MEIIKTCITCGVPKDISEFYKNRGMADGHAGKCKGCQKVNSQKNYRKGRPSRIAYEKAREQSPERKAQKAEARKRHREKHPERYKARTAVGNALRDGRLVKELCPCGREAQAHHEDYSKPLEVTWLCRSCHVVGHGKVPF